MKLVKTIFLLLLIAISIMQNWLWLAGLLVIYYSVYYRLEGLIVVAVLVDGYFGNFSGWPWLSLVSVFWFLIIYSLRQKIVNIKES